MARILVTGSESGLGFSVSRMLSDNGHHVIQFDTKFGNDVRNPNVPGLRDELKELDVLVNCAGINRINWLEDVSSQEWDDVVDTNAKGIFMMTQAVLPLLVRSKGTVLNIVSNASHMPMTCSAAYNSSKGAAHILTLQLARELTKRHGICVFGISPNKLSGTGMSDDIDEQVVRTRGWTKEQARIYQLGSLLWGEETSTQDLAQFISGLLEDKQNHKWFSGCIIPFGA